MIRIRIAYDAYNRSFTLLDREFGPILDDAAVYELALPLTLASLKDDDQFVCIDTSRVAQA